MRKMLSKEMAGEAAKMKMIDEQCKIRFQYADLVDKNLRELCMTCGLLNNWMGQRGVRCYLLPVTSKGENCPYYTPDSAG